MGSAPSKNDKIVIVYATDLVYCVKKLFNQLVLFKNRGLSDKLIMECIQTFADLLECSIFSVYKNNRFIYKPDTFKLKELLKTCIDDIHGKKLVIKYVDYIRVKELMKNINE